MLLPEASVENALNALNILKISLADRLKAACSLKPDRRGFAAKGFPIKVGAETVLFNERIEEVRLGRVAERARKVS